MLIKRKKPKKTLLKSNAKGQRMGWPLHGFVKFLIRLAAQEGRDLDAFLFGIDDPVNRPSRGHAGGGWGWPTGHRG